jgi:glucan phosphoethanolaminetransferase (alkaline phosphatase superfamily)
MVPVRRTLLLSVALIVALAAYVLLNHLMVGNVTDEFSSRGFAKSAVYIAWLGCGFAVFTALVVTAHRGVLAALLVATLVSVATNYAYADIVKQLITPTLMEWMAQELGQLPHASAEYTHEITMAIARAVALLAVFVGVRVIVRRFDLVPRGVLESRRVRLLAIGAFLAFHGVAMLLQPSYTVAETNVYVYGVPASFTTPPQRRDVPVRAAAAPVEKILFVLDESVGYHIYTEAVAPLLRGLPALDYGEAASLVACSASSNALLRWGLEKPGIGKAGYDPRTNPTIWAFARAAGFRTTLIDGQSKGAMQNFLSSGELALIDEFITADVGVETDRRVARMLRERLARPGRELIWFVKRGSHFPYEMNYAAGTLPQSASKREKYAAAVSYSTGGFFGELEGALPLERTLLVYTSDHGQNLASRAVHCSDQRHPDEFSVPLVAVTGDAALRAMLASGLPAMRGRASHLNVFPTLLAALGYPSDWVTSNYGATLAGPPGGYVTVGWVPYPTRKEPTMDAVIGADFPGRAAASKAAAGGAPGKPGAPPQP